MRIKMMLCGLIILAVVAAFVGCFFERVSWSPDGRYVAYIDSNSGDIDSDNDGGILWRWDSQTNRTEALPLRLKGADGKIEEREGKTYACHYMPSGDKILILADIEDEEDNGIYFLDFTTKLCTRIDSDTGPYWDVSKDGKSILYTKNANEDGQQTIVEFKEGEGKQTVLRSKAEMAFPSYGPAGKRILYMVEENLCVFDRDTETSRSLVTADDKDFYWPMWVDANTVLYLLPLMKKANRPSRNTPSKGNLFAYSLDDGTTRTLAKNVHLFYSPSISPDRRSVALTMAREDDPKNDDFGRWQIATVDLASAKTTWATDALLGASSPAFSPDGKRLAYQLSFGKRKTLEVLDLETKQKTLTFRDEEERLFGEAESLARKGEKTKALAAFEKLTSQFPKSNFNDAVKYRSFLLHLEEPDVDLDAAYAILKGFDGLSYEDLPAQAKKVLWPEDSKLATDPPKDWIQTYGTNASKQAFEFDTDLTRDLRAVWVRWGKEHLYVRVDYGSGRDLAGIAFQDALLAFDYDSPDKGLKTLTPSTDWERGAERQVLIRHWFSSGEKSQYDLEIKNGEGEVVGRYLASGFAPPENPIFSYAITGQMDDERGDANVIVYSISRKTLGLEEGQKVHLQVCTLKGGADSQAGSEKPRVVSADGRTVCDIADAFGAENSRKRIEQDLKKSADKSAPAILKGEAGSFVLQ